MTTPKASEEQVLYGKILNIGMIIGLLGLVITFALYVSGVMPPLIPMDKLQAAWSTPLKDYLHETGIPTGWSWVGNVGYGDMLNFIPIAFLSGITILCYLAIIPGLLRKKDTAYVVIAIMEVIVLSLAASGIFGTGGH